MTIVQLSSPAADNLNLPRIPGTTIFGHFDCIDIVPSGAYVCGWVLDGSDSTTPCEITIHAGGRIIGRGVANHSRPDVQNEGAPHDRVGFRVQVYSAKANLELRVYVTSRGQTSLLHELILTQPLPERGLTRNDVISTFRLLFGRNPENEDTINHQLSVHSTRASLFNALFRSPEFHGKNMDLVALVKQLKVGT